MYVFSYLSDKDNKTHGCQWRHACEIMVRTSFHLFIFAYKNYLNIFQIYYRCLSLCSVHFLEQCTAVINNINLNGMARTYP